MSTPRARVMVLRDAYKAEFGEDIDLTPRAVFDATVRLLETVEVPGDDYLEDDEGE